MKLESKSPRFGNPPDSVKDGKTLGLFEKYILSEWAALKQAPVSFILAVSAATALSWSAFSWRYTGQIENLEGRIKLQADQIVAYKEKLNGATPEEARQRVQALEKQLRSLVPRQLDSRQIDKLKRALSNNSKGVLATVQDSASADAESFIGSIEKVFIGSGWQRGGSLVEIGPIADPPRSGLALCVFDPKSLTPMETVVKDAFMDAEIEFELRTLGRQYKSVFENRSHNPILLLVTVKNSEGQ